MKREQRILKQQLKNEKAFLQLILSEKPFNTNKVHEQIVKISGVNQRLQQLKHSNKIITTPHYRPHYSHAHYEILKKFQPVNPPKQTKKHNPILSGKYPRNISFNQ